MFLPWRSAAVDRGSDWAFDDYRPCRDIEFVDLDLNFFGVDKDPVDREEQLKGLKLYTRSTTTISGVMF